MAVVLAAAFLYAGATKLLQDAMASDFLAWGYPRWFLYAVGAAEVVGGALVLHPRTATYGGGLLALVMAGAAATHVRAGAWGMAALAAAFGALALFVAAARRDRALGPAGRRTGDGIVAAR